MCGRASLTATEKELQERFGLDFYEEDIVRYNPIPNFNIAPTQMIPVITGEDSQHFHVMRWGLIPSWAKDKKIGASMINARIETVEEKPAFRTALIKRRCLIPLDGFYEWETSQKFKIPYRIKCKDQSIFACAGLFEVWQEPAGEKLFSCTILTQPANDCVKSLHDRMPVILLKENEKEWIDPSLSGKEALQLCIPYPAEEMEMYRVSERVNKVKENDEELIKRVS